MTLRLICLLCAVSFIFSACDSGPLDSPPDEQPASLDELLVDSIAVTLNPNDVTPLAAEAVFETTVPARVVIEVLGDEPVVHEVDELATEHAIPVLGLYPDTDNRVVIRLSDAEAEVGADTFYVTTDPLPEGFPTIDIVEADTARMEEGWTLSGLSLAGGDAAWRTQPIIFDTDGDIRWYMDTAAFLPGLAFPVKRFANGNMMISRGHHIYEYDMLGRKIRQWDLDDWMHHEVTEKPDGNLLVAVDKAGRSTVEDHIVELDRASGAVVNEWDLREVLDVHRRDYSTDERDWLHMNAIWYDEDDDALIISGRNQGVVKVTSDNELVWILAPHKGWGPAGIDGDGHDTADFLLTAVDQNGNAYPEPVQQGDEAAPDFDWPWGQHAPVLLPNGNLFVFDNGLTRNFTGSNYSRGVEYEIDESAMTVREVWQYGKERGAEFYSNIISDVDVLPETGNRLIMPGTVNQPVPRALVTEVTYPGKDVVFEASIEFENLRGNGQGWGEMDIVYRSERMPLYPD